MPRCARVVVPGAPHHVTQRGARRQATFFDDADYRLYLTLLAAWTRAADVRVWAYCLMPNHVHLILVPSSVDGLTRALSETHRRYTRQVNARQGWTGYLWQGRFSSVAMDEGHLMAASLYVSLNPVRAGLARTAEDWRWSSVHAHLAGRSRGLVEVEPLLSRTGDFQTFLNEAADERAERALRRAERGGRPLGTKAWVAQLGM